MSASYKVRKYLSKMEKAPLDDLERYYNKVRKYKIAQSGGADDSWPWRVGETKLKEQDLTKIDEAKKRLSDEITSGKEAINKKKDSITGLMKSSDELSRALKDALEMLTEISTRTVPDLTELESSITALKDVIESIGDIKQLPTPGETWNEVISKSKGAPGAPSAPSIPPSAPEEQPAEAPVEQPAVPPVEEATSPAPETP